VALPGHDAGAVGDGEPHDAQRRGHRPRAPRRPIVALKAMTLWAGHQHFEEKTKGSIEVGKLADFAILSGQPASAE
jgi:predicted amidohydrolase YtcJ